MTVHEVLSRCHELGVTLASGPEGRLRVSPPGVLPEELRQELKQRKAEVLALLTQKTTPDYHKLYEAMTRQVPEDMPLVDSWLADAHPALWQKIRTLDDALSRMEQLGAPEGAYLVKLSELLAVCQEARRLYLVRRQQARVWAQ